MVKVKCVCYNVIMKTKHNLQHLFYVEYTVEKIDYTKYKIPVIND